MLAIHDKEEAAWPDAMVQLWPSGRVEFSADYRAQAPAEALWAEVARMRMGDCGPKSYRALVTFGEWAGEVGRFSGELAESLRRGQPAEAASLPREDLSQRAATQIREALECLRAVGVTG